MNTSKYTYENLQPFIKIKSNENEEEIHYSALYEDTTEDFKRYAESVLNETEEKKAEAIGQLKDFLHKENIKYPDEIDDLIVIVLRHSKYNIKKSETELKHLLQLRQDVIKRLKKMGRNKLETIIDDITIGGLPYRDKEGRAIIFTRPNYLDDHSDAYDFDDAMTCVAASLFYLLTFPMTSIYGVVYIGDMKCQSQFLLFRRLKSVLYFAVRLLVNVPIRYRKIAVVNESIFGRIFFRIISPFLPRKLLNRISFHGENLNSLPINQDILPTEFGGNLGPLNNTFYREKLLLFIQKFLTEDQECQE